MSFKAYTQNISAGEVFKFALLPDFKSRFADLGMSLSWFVTFFAAFFFEAGLIDKNHPCLRAENVGKYGFRDVIGIAYSNIKWKRENIPQILLFVAVLSSLAISVVFIFTAIFYYLVTFAHAQQSITGQSLFSLPASHTPQNEYALDFLARVFGNTGIGAFNPDEASASYSWLTIALQNMLEFYSNVLLFIGGFIVLYYIVMLVVEAAHTGKPLGGRYSPWAPVRLALGIALLVPFASNGYNGAQLVIFQSMAWGSNLATNIWITALEAYGDQCKNGKNCMIGTPQTTNNGEFVRGVYLISTCMRAYNAPLDQKGTTNPKHRVFMRIMSDPNQNAKVYTFGIKANPDYCGSYRVPIPETKRTDKTYVQNPPVSGQLPIAINQPTIDIQEAYNLAYNNIIKPAGTGLKDTFFGNLTGFSGHDLYEIYGEIPTMATEIVNILLPGGKDVHLELYTPDKMARQKVYSWLSGYQSTVITGVNNGVNKMNIIAGPILNDGAKGGWANAGAFYLSLAKLNGGIQSAVSNAPEIIKLPEILGNKEANAYGESPSTFGRGNKSFHENFPAIMERAKEWWDTSPKIDGTADLVGSYGYARVQNSDPGSSSSSAGSIDANSVFNMFEMNKNLVVNDTLNPLGQLTTLGGWLVENSLGAIVVGGILTNAFGVPGIGYFIMSIGMLFLSAGMALWVVLPLLPFFYFTFGVINWVIAVFEAIVGAPLWALSFLKIDGAGLPGKGMNGIYLIFLLFLHPTLMIFGLVGSILVFSAAVNFLNTTFSIVTENIMADKTGFGRGVSGICYIIVYVIIVYMVGQSVFKMIDSIPKKISRFMGQGSGPDTYSEMMGDGASLQAHTLMIAGGISSMGKASQKAAGDFKKK